VTNYSHTQAAQLLDESPDFGTVGGNFLRNLGSAHNHRRVLHEEAEDPAKADVGGIAGFRGWGPCFNTSCFWFLDAGIMRERGEKHKQRHLLLRTLGSPEKTLALHRGYAQAHVCGVGGVGEEADGNKIDAGFGVGANVFETDAAGALNRDAALQFCAAVYGAAHVFGGHVIEQNGFRAVGEGLLQLGHGTNFYFDWLRAATVAKSAFLRWNGFAG